MDNETYPISKELSGQTPVVFALGQGACHVKDLVFPGAGTEVDRRLVDRDELLLGPAHKLNIVGQRDLHRVT